MTVMRPRILAIATLALVVAACQGGDRLGNQESAPVTLRAETVHNRDEVDPFVLDLAARSRGALQLVVEEVSSSAPGDALAVIDRLRSGAIDLGIVATREWSSAGVHAYDALHAPLLIDSLDLERAVLASDVLDEGLAELEALGLVPVGVVAGPLRIPAGRERALLGPDDFKDLAIGISASPVTDMTITALGARPIGIAPGAPVAGLDGVEAQVDAITGNGYETAIGHLAGNVVLWPRPLAIVANKGSWDSLSAEQQDWLRTAAAASLDSRITALQGLEREATGIACRQGATITSATPGQLAALRAAVEPVYASLRQDEATARALDAIEAMVAASDRRPRELACPDGLADGPTASPAATATEIDGTWQACPTVEDIVAAGGATVEAEENAGCSTMVFDHGVFREEGAIAPSLRAGTYSLHGDHQLTIQRANGELFQFTWSLYRDQLTLGLPHDPRAISPAPVRAVPLTRQGG